MHAIVFFRAIICESCVYFRQLTFTSFVSAYPISLHLAGVLARDQGSSTDLLADPALSAGNVAETHTPARQLRRCLTWFFGAIPMIAWRIAFVALFFLTIMHWIGCLWFLVRGKTSRRAPALLLNYV